MYIYIYIHPLVNLHSYGKSESFSIAMLNIVKLPEGIQFRPPSVSGPQRFSKEIEQLLAGAGHVFRRDPRNARPCGRISRPKDNG